MQQRVQAGAAPEPRWWQMKCVCYLYHITHTCTCTYSLTVKSHCSLLTYGSTHTCTDLTSVAVSQVQGHTGAVIVLADGLNLLLRETDYHQPPIYPHKHPSCTERIPGYYVNKADAPKLFHTWSTSYANSVTGLTRSKSRWKMKNSSAFMPHTFSQCNMADYGSKSR